MVRMIPAVLVSERNDEVAIARAPGLAQASRDLGFDTIYDLIVERDIIAGKIDSPRDCLRHVRSKKEGEQREELERGFHRKMSAKKGKAGQEERKGPRPNSQ